jgi:cytochrome P450
LRENAPVYWNAEVDGPGFWALTRYDDVLAAYRDPATFSSARGNILNTHRGATDPGAGKMLSMTDPPRHTKLRQLVNRSFSPRAVAALESTLRPKIRELLAQAIASGPCDFVDAVAAPIPVLATCLIMGVPEEDWPYVFELTRAAFSPDESEYGATTRMAGRSSLAHSELLLYCAELVAGRRREGGDDVVSILASATIDGVPLTNEEIVLACDNLIVGGNETTRYAAAVGLLAFADHPREWQAVKDDPELAPLAVEEILRWASPAMHVLRTLTRDVEIRGATLRAGDTVTLWNASANRDEAIFPNPDLLDVRRRPNRHLALGSGEHFCIGAGMARLELRVLLEELARCAPAFEIRGPVERLRSTLIRGLKHLRVTLAPR